jgi:hypothetical protein
VGLRARLAGAAFAGLVAILTSAAPASAAAAERALDGTVPDRDIASQPLTPRESLMLRRAAAAVLFAGLAATTAAPAAATEVCAGHSFGEKLNGLWVAACVGDERPTPVYVTCGSYTLDCAR